MKTPRLADRRQRRRKIICQMKTNFLLNQTQTFSRERNRRTLDSSTAKTHPWLHNGPAPRPTQPCGNKSHQYFPPSSEFCYLYLGPLSLGLVGGGGDSKSCGFSHVVSSGLAGLW